MERASDQVLDGHLAAQLPVRVLHLIIDEKFFSFVYEVFREVAGAENRYVALVDCPEQEFTHIGGIPLWRAAGAEYAESAQATEDLTWCNVLLVHWRHEAAASVVAKAPNSVIVVWSGWGGDYYSLLQGGESALYGEQTRQLLRRLNAAPSNTIRGSIRRVKEAINGIFGGYEDNAIEHDDMSIGRFDYFSAPIRDDYDLLKIALDDRFRAEYVQLNYGSVERTFQPRGCGVSGSDILLGNSATATNNHMEMISLLSSIDLEDRKVVVPLSYGSKEYGDEIERFGLRLLGEKFVPIREFMPLNEYNLLISSCSTVLMNHRRQQAIGNIGTALCNGAKLFLDENNVLYKFFVRKGACVFSIKEIAERGAEALTPLSDSEKERNIEVINQEWSHAVVTHNTQDFIDRMRGTCQ